MGFSPEQVNGMSVFEFNACLVPFLDGEEKPAPMSDERLRALGVPVTAEERILAEARRNGGA